MSNGAKVVIVGAGCAGLSAAYTLKKAGVDFVLYEASDAYGGRCRNVDDRENRLRYFAGAGMTEPQWHTTAQYVEELGLRLFHVKKKVYAYRKGDRLHYVMMGGDFRDYVNYLPDYLRFGLRVWPFRIYWQLFNVFRVMRRYMKSVDMENHEFDALRDISNMSTAEFVCRHGGWDAVNWFFHPFLATMVLARPQEISVAHPMSLFALMKGMCVIIGGMGEMTRGLYKRVSDDVRLNTPVRKIVIEDNRIRGVETDEGFVAADQVICAVDAVTARSLMPDLPDTIRNPLEKCTYSSTFGYHIVADKPFSVDPDLLAVMIPQDEETILSTIFMVPGKRPMLTCFTRGWMHDRLLRMTEEERYQQVVRETKRYFPDLSTESGLYKVFRWDRAVNLEEPGQYEAIQHFLKHHRNDVKGLHLAGEYLFLIACTEGALLTGKEAAERIIRERGFQ